MKKVLSITAHPDDNVLFTGTILKLKKLGWKLYEAVLTGGENSVTLIPLSDSLAHQRKDEGAQYASLVGLEKIYWLDQHDCHLAKSEKLTVELVRIIREVNPDVVITLNSQDYHKDHRMTNTITLDAIELATRGTMEALGSKIDMPVVLEADGLNLLPEPDITIDISDLYKEKTDIIKKSYPSQIGTDLFQFLDGLATVRGARVKTNFGEAFNLLKVHSRSLVSPNNINSLRDLLK